MGDRFPGGVVTAELAALPAGAGVQEVSGQLGVASPEAAAVGFAGRPALVVLDNCEHVLDGVALFVCRLLGAADPFRVVATSREPLGLDGERLLVLGGLGLPSGDVDVQMAPAVQLFLQRAESAGAPWEPTEPALSAVGELCRRLDGLPLAIELAAARARVLSPADYLSHTEHWLDLLHGRQRDLGARHGSIRDGDRRVGAAAGRRRAAAFQRLSVFPGLFDVELAHAVVSPAGADRLRTVDLLAQLVERSLVSAVPVALTTRYRLLELLREHAFEGLVRNGEWDDGHRDGSSTRSRPAPTTSSPRASQRWSAELLATVANDFRNLVTAVEWCVDRDDAPDRAFRLLLPMFGAVHQSRGAEVLALGRRVLARWPDEPAPWRAEVLAVLATAAVVGGNVTAATELGTASVAEPDATAIARVVAGRALGFAVSRHGRPRPRSGALRRRPDGGGIHRRVVVRARAQRVRGVRARPPGRARRRAASGPARSRRPLTRRATGSPRHGPASSARPRSSGWSVGRRPGSSSPAGPRRSTRSSTRGSTERCCGCRRCSPPARRRSPVWRAGGTRRSPSGHRSIAVSTAMRRA